MLCDNLEGWDDGVGGRFEREGTHTHTHTHACGSFTLLYDRNQHNILKQLSSN